MVAATGGLCLNVTNMERGVALFEREAILHVASREKSTEKLPVILNESSLSNLGKTSQLVEDVQRSVPQAMSNQVMKQEDVTKAEQAAQTATGTHSGAVKRIFAEYRSLINSPVPQWSAFITADNSSFWKVIMEGPPGTPYEGGKWILFLNFPRDFPFKPPEVRFITPIYHCNVNNDGRICLSILKDSWSPALRISNIFTEISMLITNPNPTDALDAVKANVYSDNKDVYNNLAAEHAKAHASSTLQELKRQYQIEDA